MIRANGSFAIFQGAALALVAWYLMVPPLGDNHSPPFRWNSYGKFDSAQECRTARDLEIKWAEEWAEKGNRNRPLQPALDERSQFDGLSASCITSDELLPKDESIP